MKIREILNLTNNGFGSFSEEELNSDVNVFEIDSRNISKGDVFVALKGRYSNGEDFVPNAIKSGASLALVTNEYCGECKKVIKCDDVVTTLGQIAKYYLSTLDVKIIAVTGSVGKTSTKDIIASVLSYKYKVFKTIGNFNSNIGVPLMILRLRDYHEYAVLEMGMDRIGDIESYSNITHHKIAAITNIGFSHFEHFGSQENIFKGKMEIATNFDSSCILFLNANDNYLSAFETEQFNIAKVGRAIDNISAHSTIVKNDGTDFILKLNGQEYKAHINLLGEHNVTNSLLAVAIADYVGMKPEEILSSLNNLENSHMRFEKIEKGGIIYINDSYNASYESFEAGLKTFNCIDGQRKIAVIGQINECGAMAEKIHSDVGLLTNRFDFDKFVFVGPNMKWAYEKSNKDKEYFEKIDDASNYLKSFITGGDAVYLKASRGMEFEKILSALIN